MRGDEKTAQITMTLNLPQAVELTVRRRAAGAEDAFDIIDVRALSTVQFGQNEVEETIFNGADEAACFDELCNKVLPDDGSFDEGDDDPEWGDDKLPEFGE